MAQGLPLPTVARWRVRRGRPCLSILPASPTRRPCSSLGLQSVAKSEPTFMAQGKVRYTCVGAPHKKFLLGERGGGGGGRARAR